MTTLFNATNNIIITNPYYACNKFYKYYVEAGKNTGPALDWSSTAYWGNKYKK